MNLNIFRYLDTPHDAILLRASRKGLVTGLRVLRNADMLDRRPSVDIMNTDGYHWAEVQRLCHVAFDTSRVNS